jgi:hypothetical protein
MTIHYHGTPITPRQVLLELGGKHFCVSFADPRDVLACHQIGQSVMIDNGSFSFHTKNKPTNWDAFYAWLEPWLNYKTTWFIVPDIIGGSAEENDELLKQNPFNLTQSTPVWHLHEPIARIFELLDAGYEKIAFGSSAEYWLVGSPKWHRRMHKVFNEIVKRGSIPWCHMLRGMQMSGECYPFSSVDSTDVARNHKQTLTNSGPKNKNAKAMADRWDALQCPAIWMPHAEQEEMAL